MFTLSHCQSQVERGFNVNKDVLCVNMERSSLKARRMVYDHMTSSKVPVANFVIKKELVQSCKASHLKYTANMEERRKENTNQAGAKRKTLLQEEHATVKRKLETVVSSLQKDIEK